MKLHYDVDAVADEVRLALDGIAQRHGLGGHWHPLMVCIGVEVLASPMKALASHNKLGLAVAGLGVDLYAAS